MRPADTELVKRYQEGDVEAFNEIYEKYSELLLGFLTRMCGNYEDAKDTLQDTFLAVFKSLDSFRGECSLKNWVYKIGGRHCSKMRNRKGKERPLAQDPDHSGLQEAMQQRGKNHSLFEGIKKWGEDPERDAIDGEIYQHIAEEVASMPYIYRIVLVLRDFEGFSGQEVAEILGIKETTGKVRLHRARLQLRDRLQRKYASPGAKPTE